MPQPIGKRRWAIAEGYIPEGSTGPEPEMTSHETACLLNATDDEAHVELTIYFADREPAGPYRVTVEPRRTKHVRFNDLADPEPIPRGTEYACVIESAGPCVGPHPPPAARPPPTAWLPRGGFGQNSGGGWGAPTGGGVV
ncbi:MAG: sensory rhodopsin transducer, partial [Rhodothermales bacterium]|nr:sensory rhodopsin transducer [Rhodothermales bacterium]